MTRPMAGGRRRVDRVLDPAFVEGLADISMVELRARRKEAEQEEVDLSYLRRMLHGRMDIVQAELARRESSEDVSVVDSLVAILSDGPRSTFGSGRHATATPSRVSERRRGVEVAIGDAEASDIEARSIGELVLVLEMLRGHESVVSQTRREVQTVMDTLSAELAGRYRDGLASIDDLLNSAAQSEQPAPRDA